MAVIFTVTATFLTESGGFRPGGEAELSLSEDKASLVFTRTTGAPVVLPIVNIKKLGPMPKSSTATTIFLDLENLKLGQVKIACTNTEYLKRIHAFLAQHIGVLGTKKKTNVMNKFLTNPHMTKIDTMSPSSKHRLEKERNPASRPASSLSANPQSTQVTSPRVSGTLTSASRQQQSLPQGTNTQASNYKRPQPGPWIDAACYNTENRGGNILPTSQTFSGRHSRALVRPSQAFANPTTPSAGRTLHIKPRERVGSPVENSQRSARKRTNSEAAFSERDRHENEFIDNGGWNDRDESETTAVPHSSPSGSEVPKKMRIFGNVSPVKATDPEVIDLVDDYKREPSPFDLFRGPFSYRGMTNLGNSCYMNASLQALASSPDFIRRLRVANLIKSDDPSFTNSDVLKNLVTVYHCLFASTYHEQYTYVRPAQNPRYKIEKKHLQALRDAAGAQLNPEFATTSQQDAHEFLFMLLDHIKDEIGRKFGRPGGSPSSDKENGPPLSVTSENDHDFEKSAASEDPKCKVDTIGDELEPFMAKCHLEPPTCSRNPSDLFGFKCVAKSGCDRCGKSNDRIEESTDFQLGIREGDWSIKSLMVSQFAREQLYDYSCENCKGTGPGFMTTAFRELPENLIVVLKRYNYDKDTMRLTKCRQDITVERELMLKELCEDSDEKRHESAARAHSSASELQKLSSESIANVHTSPVKAPASSNNTAFSPMKGLIRSPWKGRRLSAHQQAQSSQQSTADVFVPTQQSTDSTEDIFDSQNSNKNDDEAEHDKADVDEGDEFEEEAVDVSMNIDNDIHAPKAVSPMPTVEEQPPAHRESSSPEEFTGLRQTGGGTAESHRSAEVPEDPVPRRHDSDADSVVVTAQSPSSNKTVLWRPLTAEKILEIQNDMDYEVRKEREITRWRREYLYLKDEKMPQVGQFPREVPVDGDGNCLFRCMSWYLYNGDQNHHDTVRARVVSFMTRTKEQFREHVKTEAGIDNYLTFMGLPCEWGTDVELHAMATMFKCVIYSFFMGRWTMFKPLFTYYRANDFQYVIEEDRVDWEKAMERDGAIYIVNSDNVHFNVVSGPILGDDTLSGGINAESLLEEDHHQSYDDLDTCKPASPPPEDNNDYNPHGFDDFLKMGESGTANTPAAENNKMDVDEPVAPTYEFKEADDPVYTLTAVVNHSGESLRYGHYTCYSFDSQRNIWLDCNDSLISKVEESEVLKEAGRLGYMFVYRRRHAGDTQQFKPSDHYYY